MATQFSMLQIINAALTAQGQDPISDNDGSAEWSILTRNWPLIVEAELEDGAYNFNRSEEFLATRIDGKFGFDDGYMVPLNAIHVRAVWTIDTSGARVFQDWTQDGSNVYVDCADGVYAELVTVADVDLWSANFCRGVQMKMEAVILRSMKEESRDAAEMEQRAEVYFERARAKSSKSRSPTEPYREGRFAAARFRRG